VASVLLHQSSNVKDLLLLVRTTSPSIGCCHFIDFESMVSKCEGGFSSCTQQSDNTEACSASND